MKKYLIVVEETKTGFSAWMDALQQERLKKKLNL
jgi:hypothetical protein